MGINGAQTFGSQRSSFTFGSGRNANNNNQEERQKAEFWMNIGYLADTILEGETEPRFISLPAGIPLDTSKPLELRGNNEVFRSMVSAQNDLLEAVLAEARKLEPGQSVIIGDPETQQLVIQLRRVQHQEAIAPSNNVFGRGGLSLVA